MEPKRTISWSLVDLKRAINKVLSNQMGVREAALKYGIPKSTLHDRTQRLKAGEDVVLEHVPGGFKRTFSEENEEEIARHITDLSNRCMPLTKKEFLKLAYDFAEDQNITHRFNKEKGEAGRKFYEHFTKKHGFSLRTPESTSLMRAVGFNRPQVELFYTNLEKLIAEFQFDASRIYNCDETGVNCVPKHEKVVAPKTVRQVGKLTSAERGKNITVLFCMSATGHYTPPFFVFPRHKMNPRLMVNAPAQSKGVAQPRGWMIGDFFLQFLQHFVQHVRPTKESPVLLILDGHSSHKTLEVIKFCKENFIELLSLPPHTSHKLQPLDRTFMKPFKNAYHERCGVWMRKNAGARITDYDIAGLVSEAYLKVARVDIAVSGFQCTGIYPFNPHNFSDTDFLPCDLTNIPLNESTTDKEVVDKDPDVNVSTCSANEAATCIQKLSPLPDAVQKRTESRKRKSEKSTILTSSANITIIEEKDKTKRLKESMLDFRKKQDQSKRVSESNKENRAPAKPLKRVCLICRKSNKEGFIRCSTCKDWTHKTCAGITKRPPAFLCHWCNL